MNIIGKNIKKLREECGVTQEQLAHALHISFQAVSKWENSQTVPDTLMLPQIAEFFGVPIDELFQKNLCAYRNRGHRLASVCGNEPSSEHFFAAESELQKAIAAPPYPDRYLQAEDLRSLAELYRSHMAFCREQACRCYDLAIERAEPMRKELFACFEQQKIYFLTEIGQGRECAAHYLKLTQKEPDNCEHFICAILAHFCIGDYERAAELGNTAIAKWGDNLMLHYLCGNVCRKRREYDRAFAFWETSLALNQKYRESTHANGFTDALFSMADCYQELGELDKARATWQTIADGLEEMGFSIEAEQALARLRSI